MAHSFRRVAAALVALAVVGAAGAGVVLAHGGATGIVKERMDLMKGIGDAMKTLTAMFKGEVAYDPDAVRAAARTIRSRAGEHMTTLFPEGSLHKPTEALPAIWEDWPAFRQYANELETYSAVLEAAAGNAFGPSHGGAKGRGPMMGGQGRSPMMGGGGSGAGHPMNDPEALKRMPPMASFLRLSQTCNACHTRFRVKK